MDYHPPPPPPPPPPPEEPPPDEPLELPGAVEAEEMALANPPPSDEEKAPIFAELK